MGVMQKVLVRGVNAPDNSEVLETGEFLSLAFDQISHTSTNLSFSTETGELLEGMSDILELMNAILVSKNIDPQELFSTAVNLRSSEGTFMDKKAIEQE